MASLHRRETVVRRATCGLERTAGFRVALTRACHCTRRLSQGAKARALATRARRAALVVVASCTIQGHRTGERPLSSGAKPCCDMPAVASITQQAFAWRARERAIALAVYQEEAQHACLRCARAVPRWL